MDKNEINMHGMTVHCSHQSIYNKYVLNNLLDYIKFNLNVFSLIIFNFNYN